tara:strand:+ start:14018 stop:18499 length:4482 start_codon:yes stop_codon:yes gene_type:complete
MPRKIQELKQFGQGVKSSPSDTDVHPESAIYNKNIDPISEAGKLRGIKDHRKVLPKNGSLNFIVIPPWNGTLHDSSGNNYADSTPAAEQEAIRVTINDNSITSTCTNTGSARANSDAVFTAFKTLIEAANWFSSTLEGVTLGRAGNDTGNVYTDILSYAEDGTPYDGAYDSDSQPTGNIITGNNLAPYRTIGLEFKDTVVSVDITVSYIKNGAIVKTYSLDDTYDSSSGTTTENVNAVSTYVVLQDDTAYLEVNATEMESFNDEGKNNIAFYSITTADPTSSDGLSSTHRMKVLEDVYGTMTVEDRYEEDDIITYYDIPGTPADVSIEKSNAQIYVGTGNDEASKSKWFGKIKHKQFDQQVEDYRLTDAECLPIDKGDSIFNLSLIDYGYDGEGIAAGSGQMTMNFTQDIGYGISPGTTYLYAIDNAGDTNSDTNSTLGKQLKSTTTLTFTPSVIYGSRWLWDQLNTKDDDPWQPPTASGAVISSHTHEGVGHTYFWAGNHNSHLKLHVIFSDASSFIASQAYEATSPSDLDLTISFANSTQAPPEGVKLTDLLETWEHQSGSFTSHDTKVYVLFTQESDTAYTWDQEFVYYFDPDSDINWSSKVVTLHEVTPPSPAFHKYSSWRSGTHVYMDQNTMKADFPKRTHDYWAGTWNVKSNYLYWRYCNDLGEPVVGAPTTSSGGSYTTNTNFFKCKGNTWENRRMDGEKWELGENVGWVYDDDYFITPHKRGLVDLEDGKNGIGLIAHVKGTFITNAGEIKNSTWENWTPRYHYMYGQNTETESYDDIVMFNINKEHKGVRQRMTPNGCTTGNVGNFKSGGASSHSILGNSSAGMNNAGFKRSDTRAEDHHIYKFTPSSTVTNYPGENEINIMPDEISGIISMNKRCHRYANNANAKYKLWVVKRIENGSNTALLQWDVNLMTSGTVPTRSFSSDANDTYLPMMFIGMGSAQIAETVPPTTKEFHGSSNANGNSNADLTNITAVDFSILMTPSQGEYFIANARYKYGADFDGWMYPHSEDYDATKKYYSIYKNSELDFGLKFTEGDASTGDNDKNFLSGTTYYYKMTLMYDGYQESPLNTFYFTMTPSQDLKTLVVKTTLAKPPDRCSGVQIYRKNSVEEFFRLVKDFDFKKGWGKSGDSYFNVFLDDGNMSATYEAITGMPESLRDTSINYKISTSAGGYLVVGNCFHSEIENGQNFIFRSQPGNYSIFNWSRDFCVLPNEPTTIAFYGGRLYAFDNANMYRIDVNQLAIEDIHEGVGCFGEQSLTITDYGMYFCDSNNMYLHNGQMVQPIGNDILKNSKLDDLGVTNKAWHNISHAQNPYVQYDAFNQNVMFQWKDTDGSYGSWNYNIPRKRWDLIDIPSPKASVQGNLGELWLSDGDYIYKLGEGSGRKKWSHYTPSLDFGYSTIDKRLKTFKIVFNNAAEMASAAYTIKLYADDVEIDLSQYSTTKDKENVRIYSLRGVNVRKVKKVRAEIIDASVEMDSFGITYTMRTIK